MLDSTVSAAPVLVVDDDATDRIALEAILSAAGFEVKTAGSGEEALQCLLEQEFSVLLLDVVMPGLDGFEVAAIIKRRPKTATLPIVFITAFPPDVESIERAYRMGAADYLEKPLVPTLVRAKVAVFVDLDRQRRRLEEQAARLVMTKTREKELAVGELQRASRRHYRNLAEAVPNIVWTADSEGKVDYYNRRWFELTGLSVEETGKPWFAPLHPDDQLRCRAEWQDAVARGSMYESECRLRSREGGYRWQLCRAVPERNLAGTITSWLGTFTDIEENKRAEAARERAEMQREFLYRQTVDALNARDEFLSVASHELKTPVTSLGLKIELILKKIATGTIQKERLQSDLVVAGKQVDKLSRLIAQLMDVSRIKAGRMGIQPEPFDLSALARDVVARLADDAAQVGSDLELSAPRPAFGRWDRLRIDQVITNLLTNALKFGSGKPVKIRVSADDSTATIEVEDRGIGIRAEDLGRIFERFERTAEGRPFAGMGLGLYIVRQIVEAHGGTVHVSSRPGEGTTFRIDLPVEPPESERETLASAQG